MPQLPAAIAVALNAVGFTAAGGAAITSTMVTGWMISQAIGLGVSVLTMMLTEKPKMNGGGITTEGTQQGADQPRKFILGYYATAGNLITERYVYDIDKNDNRYLTQVIGVSDARIDGFEEFLLGDEKFKLLPQITPTDVLTYHQDDQLGQRPDNEKYTRVMKLRVHDGSQTTASDVLMLDAFTQDPERPTNANFKMTNTAYMIVTTKYLNDNPAFTGIPQPLAVVRGMRLYDPRKDSSNGIGNGTHRFGNTSTYEFTSNPVIMAYNILRGIRLGPNHVYGANAQAHNLPLSYWIAAANECDLPGTQPASTTWKEDIKQYRAGIEISVDEEPLVIIKELMKTCAGQIAVNNGDYLITVGPPNASVKHITDDEIIFDANAEFQMSDGVNNRFNAITATYPSPQANWQTEDAEEFKRDDLITKDGKYLAASLTFPAVPFPRQVRRLMRQTLNDSRRLRQHTIVLPPTCLGLNPTDTITWTSETNGYINKLFEIVSTTIDPLSLCVQVQLRERNPADYDFDAVSDSLTPFVPSRRPVNPINLGVKGFSVIGTTVDNRRPAIEMIWDKEVSYASFEYEVRNATTLAPVLKSTSETIIGNKKITAVLPATNYEVRAKAIKPENPNVEWGAWLSVTTPAAFLTGDDFEDGVTGLFEDAGITAIRQIADRNVPGSFDGELAWSLADSALYVWNASEAKWEGLVDSKLNEVLEDTMVAVGLATIKVVSALPATGTSGQQVVYQGKLYRWTGTKWQTAIEALGTNGQLTSDQIESIAVAKLSGQIDGSKISNTAINAQHLAANSVTTLALAADAVEAANIKTGAVLEAKLANNAVSLAKLANNAVDASKLVNNAVTELKIAANAVTNAKIAAGAVIEAKLANNAVTLAKIADNAVNTNKLVDGAVSELKIADNAVSNLKIATNAITETKISNNAISTPKIQVGAITTDLLAANSVTAVKITAGAVTANAIAANSITALHIVANTITGKEIAGFTITANNIMANTITANQIAANTITSNEIKALTITGAEIAATTITGAKIVANTITALQIAANTITAAEIAGFTITGNKIAANTITAAQIAANTITASEIAARTITTNEIAANTIVSNNIVAGAVSAREIAAGAIVASKLAIADFTNLVPDDQIQDVSAWITTTNGGWTHQPTTPRSDIRSVGNWFYSSANHTAAGDSTCSTKGFFPVTPGDVLFVSGQMIRAGGTKMRVLCQIIYHDKNDVIISGVSATFASVNGATNTAADYKGELTVPAGAMQARFRFYVFKSDTDSNVYFASPTVRIKNKGEMIVDGTITGNHIAANTISGNSIVAGSILGDRIAANTISGNNIIANSINANSAIIDGTITSALIKTGAIGADQIAAGSIVASKFAVTDFTNLVPDDQMLDVNSWIIAAVANNVSIGTSSSVISSRGIFTITPGGPEVTVIHSKLTTCVEGEEYYFSGEIWSGGSADVRLHIQFVNRDNVPVGNNSSGAGFNTGFRKVAGAMVAPAGASQMRIYYYIPANSYGGANITVGSPVIRMKNRGELIVDGTITGNKIVAQTITGGLLAASGIITNSAQIENAVITSAKIANLSVDTIKIANNAVSTQSSATGNGNLSLSFTLTQASTITIGYYGKGYGTRTGTGGIVWFRGYARLMLNGVEQDRALMYNIDESGFAPVGLLRQRTFGAGSHTLSVITDYDMRDGLLFINIQYK